MRLTLAEVAGATGGLLTGGADGSAPVTSVSIDTRTLAPGALFVALRAERDGHDYVTDAFARGAVAALVERRVEGLPASAALVAVPDTADALSALGRAARHRLEGVPVVGITGSTGKTSTKDLTVAALSPAGPVGASPVSFNNEIGVPLTLLGAPEGAGAVVVEMGARGVGHIAALTAVARPTVGVITNIGVAHAELFVSRVPGRGVSPRELVARAKGELLEALPPSGHAVLCADDDMTPALARRSAAPVITAGLAASADVRVSSLALDAELRPSFHLETPWGGLDVPALPVRGAHQAGNAALAVAVAGLLGVALEVAGGGLAGAVGAPWRMELRRTPGGLVVLNDAYNANPTSMAAALAALVALGNGSGRRFAVLGPMAELGAVSDAEHRRIGRLAAGSGLAGVVAVGPGAAPLAEGSREAGADAILVEGPAAAVAVLAGRLRPGDAVLVKASRVAGLELVAAALLAWPDQGGGDEAGLETGAVGGQETQ